MLADRLVFLEMKDTFGNIHRVNTEHLINIKQKPDENNQHTVRTTATDGNKFQISHDEFLRVKTNIEHTPDIVII